MVVNTPGQYSANQLHRSMPSFEIDCIILSFDQNQLHFPVIFNAYAKVCHVVTFIFFNCGDNVIFRRHRYYKSINKCEHKHLVNIRAKKKQVGLASCARIPTGRLDCEHWD